LAPTILSLTLLNFLGCPFASQSMEIEIEVTILDKMGRVVKTYLGFGQSTEYGAFYWGYSPVGTGALSYNSHVGRAVSCSSLLEATQQIRRQIQHDSSFIRRNLP
jgi:hypothetical protein